MADETYSFTTARTRLEEIVTQVRKKDTSLEKSLDLLEEGVRLANACTELIDRADWVAPGTAPDSEDAAAEAIAEEPGDAAAEAIAEEPGEAAEDAEDDVREDAWTEEVPADEVAAEDDPSADER